MPRGAKKNAHQHNNRHENGIVAPGKRIIKQKSNGHLSGSPDGRSRADTPPLASASAAHVASQASDSITDRNSTSVKESTFGGARHDDRERGPIDLTTGEVEAMENGKVFGGKIAMEANHRKIDVSSMKPRSVYDNSGVHLAFTVLKACPLRDTLAILTFLLSLPPTFLALTNAVFTILTFVPPTGSFSGFPSLSDIFQGYSSSVSFSTMCIIDLIGVAVWLPLFRPLQSLVLDWAQAMVATTLGGGYANTTGGSDSTLLCMSIVSATHLPRYKRLLLRILSRTWLGRWAPLVDTLDRMPSVASDSGVSGRPLYRNVKTLIALHIVMQGLGRLVRKWLLQYRDKESAGASSAPLDPEAVAGSHASETGGNLEQIQLSPMELKSKGSLQSLKDVREKLHMGKRKRKQGHYVRSQQPLWAAFAATKATIMREYEQSQATSVAMGSNATDAENLGSAPFALDDSRIWITMVRPGSFFFDTSLFSTDKNDVHGERGSSNWLDGDGIDRSNPFYVRINGAAWTSAKILPLDHKSEGHAQGQQWTGEVYGLSPASSYQCAFVRCEDDVVIHSEIVVTPPSPITDQASSGLVAPLHQTLRPSSPVSPTTILKTSIAASEGNLNDAASHQRRIRKDGKATAAALKKDLDLLNDRMSKVGTNDRGLQSRQLQQSQHMRQADDAINLISDELEAYANPSEEDPQDWQQHKLKWDDERNAQSKVHEIIHRYKEANHRESTTIQAEALTAAQKRERLQHRTSRLSDQHVRLQPSTSSGMAEKERQHSELTAKSAQRHQLEARCLEQLSIIMRRHHELQYHRSNAWQQVQAIETAYEQQAIMASQSPLSDSRPITPEGDLPGTTAISGTSTGFRFPAFGTPESLPSSSNGQSTFGALRGEGIRGRSTSMLSGKSIYTDFDEDPAPPPMPVLNRGTLAGMGTRKGSGSGSSGSGGQSPGLRKGRLGSGASPLVG